MAVLLGFIKSMSNLSRKEYKIAWAMMSVTMIKHTIKTLLIVDDLNIDIWLKEMDSYVRALTDKGSDANFKKDALYKEIYQSVSINNKELTKFVRSACKSYLNDESNSGNLKLRDYNKDELTQDINEILKSFIGLMRFFKTRVNDYDIGSVQQLAHLKYLIKDYHTRDYTIITNPDKQVR